MQLLSKELVSLEYRQHLQGDLSQAGVCRFLVAYISQDGLDSIGRHLLTRVLRDSRSFGVGSLSCSCGYSNSRNCISCRKMLDKRQASS